MTVPKNFSQTEVLQLLAAQGYTRVHAKHKNMVEMVQDRLRIGGAERARVIEGIEAALRIGNGRVNVYPLADTDGAPPSPQRSPSRGRETVTFPLDGGRPGWG